MGQMLDDTAPLLEGSGSCKRKIHLIRNAEFEKSEMFRAADAGDDEV
jgi:hypothetical protein